MIDKKFLAAEIESGKTPNQIAKENGWSLTTVNKYRRKYGILIPTEKLTAEFLTEEILNKGRPKQEVADEVGVDITSINKKIKKLGLKLDVCPYCGATFHSHSGAVRYCSTKCYLYRQIKFGKNDECWICNTENTVNGYPRVSVKAKHFLAHRLMWEIHNGKIKGGLFVCHTCDNRRCVNPSHLFLGTQKDNMSDCSKKGRIKTSSKRTRISEKDRQFIIKNYKRGDEEFGSAALSERFDVHISTVTRILKSNTD